MWNYLHLKCPTEDLCAYDTEETKILEKLPLLVKFLKVSSKTLSQCNPIWIEMEVFHNVREQYRRILHCDKCVQLLQRVGSCLRKIVLISLSETYLDLAKQFEAGLQCQSPPMLLPSCQQLEYVLIRTQSFAKLMCEALQYSKQAFCYIIQRLRLGQLVLNFTMAASVTARINILFRDILVQICDNYKKLYVWCKRLKIGITKWPKPLDLPKDLEAWLNIESSDLLKSQEVSESQSAFLSRYFEKEKNDANQTEDFNMDFQCEIGETSQLPIENIDVGEVIQRSEGIRNKKRKIENHLLEEIQKANSLKKLRAIFNDRDVDSRALLKRRLNSETKRLLNETFVKAKKRLVKTKNLDMPIDVKKEEIVNIVQSTGNKFAEYLGLIQVKSEKHIASNSIDSSQPVALSVEKLRPAKTLKQFKKLYNHLKEMLLSGREFKKCSILEKKFKNKISNIKDLINKDERNIARKLIMSTSKEFLAFFKK